VALAALVYGISLHRSPSTIESSHGLQRTASADKGPNASPVVPPQRPENDFQNGNEYENPVDDEARRSMSLDDEATTRKWVREETTREIKEEYFLLFEQLDLPSSENEALLEFLIEDAIAKTKTLYSDGIGMPEQERLSRIADIIGDAKLQQFLALEHNIQEYAEAQRVRSMLQEKDVPLTDKQVDQLLKILVDTREQIDPKPPANLDPRSMEALEYRLYQMDEYEHLVLELAPSVLSAKQVKYLFDRYQALSYMRANTLEWHKQRRADDPDDNLPLSYPSRRN
jgi:hypothetical protein